MLCDVVLHNTCLFKGPSWLFGHTLKTETEASDVQTTNNDLKGKNIWYVYMHVCVYVCLCVCVCMCICVCMCVCLLTCVYVLMHVCVYMCLLMCVCMCMC